MQTIRDDWYKYPQYYDLAFRGETRLEADFALAACAKYGRHPPRRLLEPACGSGRLIVELAGRGYEAVGFDLCRPSLAYLRRKLARRKLKAEVFEADMANFSLDQPVDAAFNYCNTFRHLLTEEAALAHLKLVAKHLRPGGIYVLGLHLLLPDEDLVSYERWSESHRGHRVTVTLRVLKNMPEQRLEVLRTTMLVRTPKKTFRLQSDFTLRLYNVRHLRKLLRSSPEFELCDVFDFYYEIDQPLKLIDGQIADTVLILRKRDGG